MAVDSAVTQPYCGKADLCQSSRFIWTSDACESSAYSTEHESQAETFQKGLWFGTYTLITMVMHLLFVCFSKQNLFQIILNWIKSISIKIPGVMSYTSLRTTSTVAESLMRSNYSHTRLGRRPCRAMSSAFQLHFLPIFLCSYRKRFKGIRNRESL